ncbi:MAG TPA: hypothetical protein VKA34_07320 [Balneolales bacterium]|nr:hypothetical protein [Balneolales bacterium]
MDFNKKNLEYVLEDATYLQDEIEALKYVIQEVPFDEKPGGVESIIEMIALIDHAQLQFYRPILEEIKSNNRPDFKKINPDFKNTFEFEMKEGESVEKVLDRIIKHRAALINIANSIPVITWQKKVTINHRDKSLFQIMQEMIQFERAQLKKVADRVMALGKEKQQK